MSEAECGNHVDARDVSSDEDTSHLQHIKRLAATRLDLRYLAEFMHASVEPVRAFHFDQEVREERRSQMNVRRLDFSLPTLSHAHPSPANSPNQECSLLLHLTAFYKELKMLL